MLVFNQNNWKAVKVVSSDPPSELETAKSDFNEAVASSKGLVDKK